MRKPLHTYKTWIFDCDGVLLDSNGAKANAFYTAALPYGKDVAEKIRAYHMNNGGISRFKKFRYVFETLLGRTHYEPDYERMVADFSHASRKELERCSPVTGVSDFLKNVPEEVRLFVISGAEEEELRWCLQVHGLAHHFQGIFGSPRSKPEVLQALKVSNQLLEPAVYFGDSRYDYESATGAGCDFVFVYGFTDFAGWRDFTRDKLITVVKNFADPMLLADGSA